MLQDVLEKLGFDWQVALANLINFLIIYLLLKKAVFNKIGGAIKDRQKVIKDGLDNAELAKTALFQANTEKEKIINQGLTESKDILLKAEINKEQMIKQAKMEASDEVAKIKEASIKEIESLQEAQTREIKKKSVDLIISGVENVLKENINQKKTEDLINSLIKN
jgi:F-type H+-transporting ATPase subunit b